MLPALWTRPSGPYEPGAWLRGRIFPRRSDLPDGRLLCYFAHKRKVEWEHGETYVALSKLPWLSALRAFAWTRGYHFTEGRDGEHEALPIPYGLRSTPVVQFATERRRGWEEAADSPSRDPQDAWDERRNARMQKRQPGGVCLLCVESLGRAGGELGTGQAVDGLRVRYWLEAGGDLRRLDDVQWADWDRQGQLLVATRRGGLQIRRLEGEGEVVVLEEDLSRLEPDPRPAPPWARTW